MRRRRDRVRTRGSLLWWPLLAVAVVLVVAGAADRIYRLHTDGVTSYGVVVVGLAVIAAYTYGRIRRWFR
ncbi:MAG TPA: hypothetical protein VFX70_09490 [Mycobacteriales bacterium]|nr:hypothetical protein [Mycobacteriales bacterium]